MSAQIAVFCGAVLSLAVGSFILWGPTWTRRRKTGYIVGLINLGKTCFLNALLQALASCPHLARWISSKKQKSESLADALNLTIAVLNGQQPIEADYYSPFIILKALKIHGWVMSAGEQDAHEIYHIIISSLKDEIQEMSHDMSISDALESRHNSSIFVRGQAKGMDNADSSEAAVISKKPGGTALCEVQHHIKILLPYQGLLTSQLMCSTCQYKTPLLYEKFNSVSLSLPSLGRFIFKRLTLAHLLDNYVASETVKDVECENCNHNRNGSTAFRSAATKTTAFGKLPQCLCFHIQRTTWEPNAEAIKRHDHVDFPEFLAMDPYTLRQVHKRKSLCDMHHNAQYPRDETKTSSSGRINHLYRLVAIIVHKGGVNNGHFITYRRAPFREHCWYYTSDHNVRESSLQEAMQVCAYMLFYTKIVHRKSPNQANINR